MNKRDLKEDLRLCKQLEDRWEEVGNRPWLTEELCIDFAHEAREGWPHAIERALKAEALVQELVEALEHIERLTELVWQGVGPVTAEIRLAVEGALEKAKEVLGDE